MQAIQCIVGIDGFPFILPCNHLSFPTEAALDSDTTIGILLPQIADRHRTEILQLMVQMDDVEEVLKYERGQKTARSQSGRQ
ncbi:hypothetical protein ACFQ3W_11480 [Paenibacillus puldeungensis]|uniref:Uncharacterized protein n=1 Tax=Paenibacillus puldeungensis TaxID=696536 RepID=A0ABW3RWQ1_9BACL